MGKHSKVIQDKNENIVEKTFNLNLGISLSLATFTVTVRKM